jgi:hypothetical protein
MQAATQRTRVQRWLAAAAVLLACYFLLVYRPLERRAAACDRPLTNLWSELTQVTLETNATRGGELPRIVEALQRVQDSVAALQKAEQAARTRLALDPGLRSKLAVPFQLIDFQNERQLRTEQLVQLAAERKVVLNPAVVAGFPEYTTDRRQPAYLWAQLSFLNQLLVAAVQSQVSTVSTVRLPPVQYHRVATNGAEVVEIPMQLALSGRAPAVARLLQSLPLRAEELKARGLPEVSPQKPAFCLDRILVRKLSREQEDLVSVELTACGFVLPE